MSSKLTAEEKQDLMAEEMNTIFTAKRTNQPDRICFLQAARQDRIRAGTDSVVTIEVKDSDSGPHKTHY
ncbi:hypothetical protein C1H76_9426 [Elsinoe australis]|uniref:Uncharacterized protein n=1 Tax=Elsinoe australis TaxID=40998 RepID=A0A4U7AQI8_9PEZI|nr:hypothetical protein C1H76_9426 [Elsinoe australis]